MIRVSLNEIKVYIHKHSKEVNNQNVLEKLYEIANSILFRKCKNDYMERNTGYANAL